MAVNKFSSEDMEQFRNMPYYGAEITDEQVKAMENKAASNDIGVWRRVMFVSLARDRDTHVKFATKETEAFAEMVEGVTSYREYLENLLEVTKSAEARLMAAGGMAMAKMEEAHYPFAPARPASKPGRKAGNLRRPAGHPNEGQHLKGCRCGRIDRQVIPQCAYNRGTNSRYWRYRSKRLRGGLLASAREGIE